MCNHSETHIVRISGYKYLQCVDCNHTLRSYPRYGGFRRY